MSGKPSVVGVQNFISALNRFGTAAERCRTLNSEISERSKSLKEWMDAYVRAKEEIFKLMEAMDIKAEGNYGYDERMSWFLSEVWAQLQPTRSVGDENAPSIG